MLIAARLFTDDLGAADWVDGMASSGEGDVGSRDDRNVCHRCFDDRGIQLAISYLANSNRCDFCGRRYRGEKAAPIWRVTAFVAGCLGQDDDIPENVLFLDSESENGWAGTTWDKWDIIHEHVAGEDSAVKGLIDCLTNDRHWCERGPGQFLPSRQLGASWHSFSRYVKHRSRYMFMREDERPRGVSDAIDDKYVASSEMLDLLGDAVTAAGMLKNLGKGTRLFMARAVEKGRDHYISAGDLGPPPESDTGPPAGR